MTFSSFYIVFMSLPVSSGTIYAAVFNIPSGNSGRRSNQCGQYANGEANTINLATGNV